MKKLSMSTKAFSNILLCKGLGFQRPTQVSFAITNRCNLKCSYCYGDYSCRKDKDFTLDQLKSIFFDLKKMGMTQIFLTGGEPLLRKDIDKIVDYLKELNIDIGIVTNAILAPLHLKTLKKVDRVLVSLDGNKKKNDLNRGEGTHNKILKSLELMHKEGIKFSLKIVFNKNSYDQLNYILKLAEKYKTDVETIIPYENFGDKSLYLTETQKKKLLTKIMKYVKEGKRIKFSHVTHKMSTDVFLKHNKSIINEDNKKYPSCVAGKLYLFIDANGDVYPCNQLIGSFKPYNIHDDGLKSAIKHTLTRKCKICCIPFLNEKRFLNSLQPEVVLSKLK
ncbi:radical SAM protein [archaeon]|jgi:MoaA/NifB/PqqE/SkfB family radical SAM enzyme|nr:radical SAM protein [archaeon]MBT4396867.1 radical SAM protein [archaeon]MBT4441455.1 radical SAM protein [archaeon]